MIDKATEEWLEAQKKSTRSTYKSYWRYFLEFTALTGDQILENRKADKEYTWEKKILEFKNWMIKEKSLSEKSATTATSIARGFFSYHRQSLKFRRTESAKLGEGKPKYEDYRFSLEDLKRMYDFADLEERYILTAGKSFGLRAGDFLRLTRGSLEAYIDRSVPISIGEYATQKEGVPAYPIIDADALPIIKLMLQQMNRQGRTKPTDKILTFKHATHLTRALKRLVQKANVNVGDKRVRFHCLRKFLTDHLSSFMSESKWKQIVGKTISEGAYVSPDTLQKDYTRAMSETCFTKRLGEGDVEKIVKKQVLLTTLKNLGISEREAKTMLIARIKAPTIDDEIEFYESIAEARQKEREDNDCLNGEHCTHMQIKESELLSYLQQGWQIVHNLQNGEVIVKR